MDRTPVESSNIQAIRYDPISSTLEVEFKSGSLYAYYNVPEFIYEQLMAAPSKGGFLNANVKNAFPYAKL